MMKTMFRRIAPVLILLASVPVMAEVTIPNTFQAGQTARASEVNANFEALKTAVEELQEQTANLRALNEHIEVMDDPNVEGGTRVVFKGVNIQIHNGDETVRTNGLGNRGFSGAAMLGTSDSQDFVGGTNSAIVGGKSNTINNEGGSIFGAYDAEALDRGSVVIGGRGGLAAGDWSGVIGGRNNETNGANAVVLGGSANSASRESTGVLAGYGNSVSGRYSVLLGGFQNSVSRERSAILGGDGNSVSDDQSAIIGWEGKSSTANNEVILAPN